MEMRLTGEDRQRIEAGIHRKYRQVAVSPKGAFKYPTGRTGLEGQAYDSAIINKLPESILESYCGVGNPFALGPVRRGDEVLDIGCGAGVDAIVAAIMTGPGGKVVGMDLTPEMLQRARTNLRELSIENVTLTEGSAEELPFPEASFDVVISNGVFNLVPDKVKALQEVYRVLRPNGRLMIADQILAGEAPPDTRTMVESWAG